MNKHNLKCPICDESSERTWHVCDICTDLVCDGCINEYNWNDDDEFFEDAACDECFIEPVTTPSAVELFPIGKNRILLTGFVGIDPVPGIWMEIDFNKTSIDLSNAPIPQFEEWYQKYPVSAIFAKEMMQQWDALEEACAVRKQSDELLSNLYKKHGPKGAFWVDTAKEEFLDAVATREPGKLTHPELLDATRCNLCFSPSKHAIDHPRGLCYPCSTR